MLAVLEWYLTSFHAGRQVIVCLSLSLSLCLSLCVCLSVFVCLSQLAEPEDRMLAVKQNTHTIKFIFYNKKYRFDYLKKKKKENKKASYILSLSLSSEYQIVFSVPVLSLYRVLLWTSKLQ